jgi:hypothetical protein
LEVGKSLNLNTDQQNRIRDYLLGQLPEGELEALDERVVVDKDFYEELLIVEDELVDEYLNNELTKSEQESFEKYFLITPERHQKLIFSKDLKTYLDNKQENPVPEPEPQPVPDVNRKVVVPPPKPKPWYYSFLPIRTPALAYAAMALVILVIAGGLFVISRINGPDEPGPVYTMVLSAGSTRGGGDTEKKFSLPPGSGTVELRPQLRGNEYATYEAVLLADDNSEIARADNLQATNDNGVRILKWRLPARLVRPDDYSLKINGKTDQGQLEALPTYRFRVVR